VQQTDEWILKPNKCYPDGFDLYVSRKEDKHDKLFYIRYRLDKYRGFKLPVVRIDNKKFGQTFVFTRGAFVNANRNLLLSYDPTPEWCEAISFGKISNLEIIDSYKINVYPILQAYCEYLYFNKME
jgi:hypothetical protein